jgi:hypothetical protein
MTFCSWFKNIFCCRCSKQNTLLDLKNDEYNAMTNSDVTVTFDTSPPNSTNKNSYSLSDEITFNDIYNK